MKISRRIVGLAGLVMIPVAVRAAEGNAPSGAATRDVGGLLAMVAGADTLPAPCGTPLALLLQSPDSRVPPELRQAASLLARRPVLAAERIAATRDGRLAIHYSGTGGLNGPLSVDRDHDGLPDLVDRLFEAAQSARSTIVARLGYPPPAPEGSRLDLYVDELGHGLEGVTVTGPGKGPSAGESTPSEPYIVIDAGLAADRIVPATIHQLAHLSLLAFNARSPGFWSEATAGFLTLAATGDWKGNEAALRVRLGHPERGLDSEDPAMMAGGLLWPVFLAERADDPSVVRQVWEEMVQQSIDPLAAADIVLRRSGRSFPDAFREYAAWNLFTGERDDGQHYAAGRALPAPVLDVAGPDLPFQRGLPVALEPLGTGGLRLVADGRGGTVDLDIRSDGGAPGADLLVFYRSWGPQPVLVPVSFDASGAAGVSIPWADAREAWLVLRNDAAPGATPVQFEVRGAEDPYAPYDLASLTASPEAGSLQVEWTTASEKGLLVWNVYRSETPNGPFTRLNSVAVPAAGDTVSDTGYLYVDDNVRPGRRYYYLLEGLTRLGLPQRSQVVSGRITPGGVSPSPAPGW